MDKIREAFDRELSKGKLSEKAKREIITSSRKTKFQFVPIITILMAALSIFLAWNLWPIDAPDHSETVSTEQANVKDLEQSIVTYTNELLQSDEQGEFYLNVGESYPLRLALEQNKGLFYSDGNLSKKEKMLLSQFIHYLQEVHVLQLNLQLQQVSTMDELLQQATPFVDYWNASLNSFKPIQDERKNPKLAAFSSLDWLVFIFAIAISLFIIVKLWKKQYRIPPIIWGLILVVSVCSLFLNMRDIGYDETSMVKAIENSLEEAHVRMSGEPTVEAIGGNSLNRYMLLSYEDGLVVVGGFSEENGFYYFDGASWGGKSTFIEPSNLGSGQYEDVRLITYIAPKNVEQNVVKMDVEGEIIQFELPKDQASIWMYRHDSKDINFNYE